MSYRPLVLAITLAMGLLLGLTAASAEGRIALVIGNSAYQSVPVLPNPANDAKAMSEFLTSAGFEVTSVGDLSQTEMRRAIGAFAARISEKGRDTVAAIYYAGHGLQVDGENYLVPVDAKIAREADVPLQAVRLVDMMNALAAIPSKARIVMLDACRNNPFSEINKVTGRGLAIVDAPAGTIVSYATSPGSEALDGDGANSPYTTAILSIAKQPGLPIEQAFKRVRFAVNDATKQQQLPWESSSLTTDFSFFPGEGDAQAVKVAAQSQGGVKSVARSVDAWKRELQKKPPVEAYRIVIDEDSVEAYQANLALFATQPNSGRVRQVMERRRLMIAWYTATTLDTPDSYRTFLAAYAGSDFDATARRLLERANTRSLLPALANTCPCVQQPIQQAPQPIQQRATAPSKKSKKEAKKEKKKKQTVTRAEPVPASPPPQAAPPPPMMPIGIGIGIMGIGGGRGMGGGGYGGGGVRQPTPMGSGMRHY